MESGDCWELLGFLPFFAAPTAAAQAVWGKKSCWNWRVAIAGICWDIPFLRCLLLLGSLPGKKEMIFGSAKSFLWNWKAICWGFPVFVSFTASWQTATKKKGDFLGCENHFVAECRLLQFAEVSPFCAVYGCLADCPGKTAPRTVRASTYLRCCLARERAESVAKLWPPNQSFFSKRTAAWQFAQENIDFLGIGKAVAGVSRFLRCLLLLCRLRGEKIFLGSGQSFVRNWQCDCFGISAFLRWLLLGRLPVKKTGRENHSLELWRVVIPGFVSPVLGCLAGCRFTLALVVGWWGWQRSLGSFQLQQ